MVTYHFCRVCKSDKRRCIVSSPKMDFRGWISADGFSHLASIQQRTSRNKLPKIVILFDEQITFSKTLFKQAFLPIVIFYQEVLRYLIVIFHCVSSVIFVLTFATFIRTHWLKRQFHWLILGKYL